jgi:uncharacterized membrane protein YcjF (UPF0283 family)
MSDRISFDGQEYESIDVMPPAVRAAYQDARFHREHSEHYLEAYRKARQTVSRVLTITLGLFVLGSIALGAWALWLLESSAPEQQSGFSIGPGYLTLVVVTAIVGIALAVWIMMVKRRARTDDRGVSNALAALDQVEGVGARVLQILLGVAAGGVVGGGYWIISNMDPSSRSQAGDVYIGIGVLVVLACIAAMYVSIEMRLKK